MAGPYYVDSDGDDTTGLSWATAYNTLQQALDVVAAGETVYARGSESPSVQVDVDGSAGNVTSPINIIGCNAAGDVDGTRYVMDWGANTCHGLYINGPDYYFWRNFEIKANNTGAYHGVAGATTKSAGHYWHNSTFHGWGTSGVYLAGDAYAGGARFHCCSFYDNVYGINKPGDDCVFYYCRFYENTSHGMYGNNAAIGNLFGCIFHDNDSDGMNTYGGPTMCMNSIFYNNGSDGVSSNYTGGRFYGCRFVNNGDYGVKYTSSSYHSVFGQCYFAGNGISDVFNSGYTLWLPINGIADDSILDGSDTDGGFLDPSAYNFNLRNDASLRNVEIQIP